MSFRALDYVVGLQCCPDGARISTRQKCVLLILANYHNAKEGASWPSQILLAEQTHMSVAQLRREILYLCEHKVLWRRSGRGRGRLSVYCFCELDGASGAEEKRSKAERFFRQQSCAKTAQTNAKTHPKTAQIASDNKEVEPGTFEPVEPAPVRGFRTAVVEIGLPIPPESVEGPSAATAWSQILKFLCERVSRASFDTWLTPPRATEFSDGILRIRVPTGPFLCVAKKYQEKLALAVRTLGLPCTQIFFYVDR